MKRLSVRQACYCRKLRETSDIIEPQAKYSVLSRARNNISLRAEVTNLE